MISFKTIRENSNIKSFLTLAEREMTPAQMKKREEIAQSMSDAEFKKRYGKDWMSVKMATATKQAMKEDQDVEEVYVDHWCAKHVYHDVFGEGVVVEGEHAVPDQEGNIEWYTVEFAHGKETVFTEDVEVMHERMHGHMMKKKKKMSEMEDEREMDDDDEDDEEEMMMKKKMGKDSVEESAKETATRARELADKLSKKNPEKSKMYRDMANQALSRMSSGVGKPKQGSYRDIEGGGNKSLRRQGIEPAGKSPVFPFRKEEIEEEQVDEALVGQQHKIDMNKNQKIDAQDFHLLRKIKKARAK